MGHGGRLARPFITKADGISAARACSDLLATLPGWFGQQAANDDYARNIPEKLTFVAGQPDQPVGLIALDFHFETTTEIWLMAVRAGHHRRGVGRALMTQALAEAARWGATQAVVSTLSPRSDDLRYAATRSFYTAMGFTPLVEFNRDDPLNPMMWMQRSIM